MVLRFNRRRGNSAVEAPDKFQDGTVILTPSLTASRLCVILQQDILPRSK